VLSYDFLYGTYTKEFLIKLFLLAYKYYMMVSLLCVWNTVLILEYEKLLCGYCYLGMYVKDKEIVMFKECCVGYFWFVTC
jgi:hypothetical protein